MHGRQRFREQIWVHKMRSLTMEAIYRTLTDKLFRELTYLLTYLITYLVSGSSLMHLARCGQGALLSKVTSTSKHQKDLRTTPSQELAENSPKRKRRQRSGKEQ